MNTTVPPIDEYRKIRRQEALKIDVETAHVEACYTPTVDPYWVSGDAEHDYHHISLELFARAPDSHIWVSFHELSYQLRRALRAKWEADPRFDAGATSLFKRSAFRDARP